MFATKAFKKNYHMMPCRGKEGKLGGANVRDVLQEGSDGDDEVRHTITMVTNDDDPDISLADGGSKVVRGRPNQRLS